MLKRCLSLILILMLLGGAVASAAPLTLPSKLQIIADEAFAGDLMLTEVVLQEGTGIISVRAFADCVNLERITLPNSTFSIADNAFAGCEKLTAVCEWGTYAEKRCNELGVSVEATTPTPTKYALDYEMIDSKTCKVTGYTDDDVRTVVVPAEYNGRAVVEIADNAFASTGITGVYLPDSVTRIGSKAFYDCSELSSVRLSENLESIGSYAFADNTSLTEIVIPESVTTIEEDAFFGCDGLKNVSIPITASLAYTAFAFCPIREVTVTGEGAWPSSGHLAWGTTRGTLERATISEGITSIGNDAFSACSSLTEVDIPDSVTAIGISAFNSCSALPEIDIPDGVTSIGKNAFFGCSVLDTVSMPLAAELGEFAFSECAIRDITLNGEGDWPASAAMAWAENPTALESLTISEGITSVEKDAFTECTALTSLTYPITAKMEEGIFGDAGIREVTLTGKGEWTDSANKPWHYNAYAFERVVISEGITSIGRYAFDGCAFLTEVVIPHSVTRIEDGAFMGCANLPEIDIPDSVTRIGDDAFANCNALTEIIIPDSVTRIGYGAFSACYELTDITFSKNMTSIPDSAFSQCRALWEIEIPEWITTIDDNAFYDSGLANITFFEGLTDIGNSAFYGCHHMRDVRIPNTVTTVGSKAFGNCFSLEQADVPEGLEIGDDVFENCAPNFQLNRY